MFIQKKYKMSNKLSIFIILFILIFSAVFFQIKLINSRYFDSKGVEGCKWCGEKNEQSFLSNIDSDILRFVMPGDHDFLSDMIWLEVIYYFGSHSLTDRKYPKLYNMISKIIHFSPKWVYPYKFGVIALMIEADEPYEAMMLADSGLDQIKDSWELYFLKGFLLWRNFEQYDSAAEYFFEASTKKNAPPYLLPLSATFAKKSGDKEKALQYLRQGLDKISDFKQKDRLLKKLKEFESEF